MKCILVACLFLCNRKLCSYYIKTLREDRTAADKKHVAYCDPPQAENPAGGILFYKKNSNSAQKLKKENV